MKLKEDNLRPVKITGGAYYSDDTGFFHKWCTEPLYDSERIFERTLALVELKDGRMKLIEPHYVRFSEPYKK